LRTGPERLRAQTMLDQAVLIEDPQKARLWLRYSSESQSLFFRATRELREAQERAAAESSEEFCRTEPGAPIDESLVPEKKGGSVTNSGNDSETDGAPAAADQEESPAMGAGAAVPPSRN